MPGIVLVVGEVPNSEVATAIGKSDQDLGAAKVVQMTFQEVFPTGDVRSTISLPLVDLMVMTQGDWDKLRDESRRPGYNRFYQKYQPQVWVLVPSGHVIRMLS